MAADDGEILAQSQSGLGAPSDESIARRAAGGVPDLQEAEVAVVGREVGDARRRLIECFRQHAGLTPTEAAAKVSEMSPERLERVRHGPVDQINWFDLSTLAESDPDEALSTWERLRKAATDELVSGHRAAMANEACDAGGPWERARFLAVRESLLRGLGGVGGVEQILLDTMATAYTQYLIWLERLQFQSTYEGQSEARAVQRDGRWVAPTIHTAEAMDQSAAMADRFNRLLCRTLRSLSTLRQHLPNVVIGAAGQVNIADTQVNMTVPQARDREAHGDR